MEFKEYVQLQELEFAGVKGKDKVGSYGKGAKSPFTTRTQFVKNNKVHSTLRDGFSSFFKDLKSTSENPKTKQYIDSLQLDTGKGGSGLADFYIKLLSHVLYDSEGNRYDLSSEKDMGAAKSALQNMSALYPGVFFLGRSILLGDDSHTPDDVKQVLINLMKMKNGLYQKKSIDANASAGELFKSGEDGDSILGPAKGGNTRIQDTFVDLFINSNKGQREGLNDIIGVPKEDWDRIFHSVESETDASDFGKKLMNVRNEIKNSRDQGGKEKQTLARDNIMLSKAEEIFGGEEPADMGVVDKFFSDIDKFGGVDSFHSGIFARNGNVPSLAVGNIGADNFAKIVKKYKVPDMDPEAIKALGQKGTDDSSTHQLADNKKQELVNAIMTVSTARDLNKWAKENLDKTGIKIDNATMAMIDKAIKDRFNDIEDNPMGGIGRYPANELTVKKLFQKYGGHSTVTGSNESYIEGFYDFLNESGV